MFDLQAAALGDRLKSAGKERSIMAGEFTDALGNHSKAEVIHQLPDLMEARGVRPDGRSLKFDGDRVVLPLSQAEGGFLESLTADTTEGLIEVERSGAAVRALGFNFVSDAETPEHPEPRFDIYQVTVASKTDPDGRVRNKLYWFETETHLLLRTTYTDGETRVETRFSNWATVDGSRYPGRIERYEDGRLMFSFTVSAVSAGPRLDAAAFR
jgi:hypothetical protein